MQLRVVGIHENKFLKDLKIGDLVLCEGGSYLPIKNVVVTTGQVIFYQLSNKVQFHIGSRVRIKTTNGFKTPELWDTVYINESLTPVVINTSISTKILFFHDILIDGNMLSPEGIVFRYGE
jgi:hypothetical protein